MGPRVVGVSWKGVMLLLSMICSKSSHAVGTLKCCQKINLISIPTLVARNYYNKNFMIAKVI